MDRRDITIFNSAQELRVNTGLKGNGELFVNGEHIGQCKSFKFDVPALKEITPADEKRLSSKKGRLNLVANFYSGTFDVSPRAFESLFIVRDDTGKDEVKTEPPRRMSGVKQPPRRMSGVTDADF